MSNRLPEVFKRLQDQKKEQRSLRALYRDALSAHGQYQQILEELDSLKTKKRQIEEAIKADFKAEFDKLEGLKLHVASDSQLLSDLAVKQLVEGEEIRIIDENQVAYEPLFSVRFKKIS